MLQCRHPFNLLNQSQSIGRIQDYLGFRFVDFTEIPQLHRIKKFPDQKLNSRTLPDLWDPE